MPRLILFHYELQDAFGHLLETSHPGRPVAFIDGEHHLIAGLERAIKKLNPGQRKELLVPARDAFGFYDQSLVISLPRSELDEQRRLEIGRSFKIGVQGEETKVFQVIGLTDTSVTLDGNHPLAGLDVILKVELFERRQTKEEEAQGGFAPAPGGFLQ